MCELLVGVLRSHGFGDVSVAEHCCNAIANMCYDEDNQARLAAAKACKLLVDILWTYGPTDSNCVRACCSAIGLIADGNDNVQRRFGATSVFDALLDVITTHGGDPACEETLQQCLYAIEILAKDNSENRKAFKDLDARRIIKSKVTALRDDDSYLRSALKVLSRAC
jgi:hypothetical protein